MWLTLLVWCAAPDEGVPLPARDRYQDAVRLLGDNKFGRANDVLNELAKDYPRVAEVFASRCSAQLGLKHWRAAEADCNYALSLKKMPTAVYGLAVALDGQARYPEAINQYRAVARLADASAALQQQASARAELLTAQTNAVAPAPPPPPAQKPDAAVVSRPVESPGSAGGSGGGSEPSQGAGKQASAPAGGAKGQFVPGIPDADEALLYVYRNVAEAPTTATTLFVDNVRVGDLWNGRYFEVRVRPGQHRVTVRAGPVKPGQPEDTLPVEVEEGAVSYVKLQFQPQGSEPAFKVEKIGKEGRKEIRSDCELVYSKKL